jgi:hypothetical protein
LQLEEIKSLQIKLQAYVTDHGEDKGKRSAQVEQCDVLKVNMDSFTLKLKILGRVETAEDTRPATELHGVATKTT